MPDDPRNPYAPPAEPRRAFGDSPDPTGPSTYESERRPVLLCIGLSLITLGFYPTIWTLRRQRFLDRLDASKKLGGLPIFVLVAEIAAFAVSFSKDAAPIRPLMSLMVGVATLIANFRVLGILRSHSNRTGRFLDFSTLGTFFLGIHYLQYKINQLADIPAHLARPRRKKKRKTTPVDGSATEASAELAPEPAKLD